MNPGETVGSGIFYFYAMTRVPEVGENASASTIQFNTVQIDTYSVSCPEEYKIETEVDSV